MKPFQIAMITAVVCVVVIIAFVTVLPKIEAQSFGLLIASKEPQSYVGSLSQELSISQRWGDKIKIQSDSEASQLTGLNVRFPTKLPEAYSLQLSVVDPTIENDKYVWLFYSKTPITNAMNVHEFWNQGGIIVIYHKTDPYMKNQVESERWLSNFISSATKFGYTDAHEITINDHMGIAYNNQTFKNVDGVKVNQPSQVEYLAEDTDITLQSVLPESELITIGQSITE